MMGRGLNGMHGISQFGGVFAPWMLVVLMVLKLAVFIAIIFIVIKLMKKHNFHSISAIRILNERYAKGEIDDEEYLKRKETLKIK